MTWHDNAGQRPCAKLLCHIWLEWLKRLARSDLLYLSHFSILEHESWFIGKVRTRAICWCSSTCMKYSSFLRNRQYMLIDWHWSGILWVTQRLHICATDVMCSFNSLELKLPIDTTLKLVAAVTKKIWHLHQLPCLYHQKVDITVVGAVMDIELNIDLHILHHRILLHQGFWMIYISP